MFLNNGVYKLLDSYLKENIIAYIGNKRRLLPFLKNTFLSLIEKDKNISIAADMFSGSGSVSRLLKTLGLKVYSNDWEYYAYILNYAHLSINPKDTEKMFLHTGGLVNTLNILNNINEIKEKDRYISIYYAPKNDDNPDLLNERLFYTQYNATKIDIIRHNIELLYKNKAINKNEYYYLIAALLYEAATHTNTSGVFKAFHAGFGGRNRDALSRILSPITMRALPLYKGLRGKASMLDASIFAKKKFNKILDIAYLDPPYNQHQYGSNYHLLNTIAIWDKPKINKEIYINGKKTNKSAIRKDWIKTKSDYCYKNTAKEALANLINNTNSRYIVMSYSTDGIIEYDELISILGERGKLDIVTSEYTRYRGAKRSIVNTNKNIEYLFIVNTNKKNNSKTKNIKKKYIEDIRLKLNYPLISSKDSIEFEAKGGNITISLKYSTHIKNANYICDNLKNKTIEYIKSFDNFLNENIKNDNLEALKIYILHFESALISSNTKIIKYFASYVLSGYSKLCDKKSNIYLENITKRIINILYLYKKTNIKLNVIEQIKKRIVYNIKHSSLNIESKDKIYFLMESDTNINNNEKYI